MKTRLVFGIITVISVISLIVTSAATENSIIPHQVSATVETRYAFPYVSFSTELELMEAVDAYLANDGRVRHVVETYGPLPDWDVSRIQNFGDLFNADRNPLAVWFNGNVSAWDVSNARFVHDMFRRAKEFNGNLEHWKVDNVIHFNGMFEGATNFEGVGLDQWNVSNGELFMVMFADTPNLHVDLRNWQLTKAQSTEAMFRNSSFGSDDFNDLCEWRNYMPSTANVSWMFLNSQCPHLEQTSLDVSIEGPFCILCPPITPPSIEAEPPGDLEDAPPPDNGSTIQEGSSHTEEEPIIEIELPPEEEPQETSQRPNILFLITDQQRFDTLRRVQDELSYYGNVTKIETPNLDQLSRQGAYFRNAYCQCSVCAPARATLRTGCTIERTGIQHNDLITEYMQSELFTQRVENLQGLDQVLTRNGYISEYYGKWHLPSILWANVTYNDFDYDGQEFFFKDESVGPKTERFLQYFERQGQISRDLEEGMQIDSFTKWPYRPIPLDPRYGKPTGTPLTTSSGFARWQTGEPNILGVNKLESNYTNSWFIADTSLRALDRLVRQEQPFFLTVSFHNPHPPMIPAMKHLDYYRQHQNQLFVSHNLYDDAKNADYSRMADTEPKYEDPNHIREWTSLYYALITEIDEYIGHLLERLGDKAENTLVIFTSDHGEMLGAHGMREKNTFYEEAARVPLLMSFPGRIPANMQVDELVSHLDIFASILDYAGLSELDTSDGSSLRPIIEGLSFNRDYDENIVVAEWDFRKPLATNTALLDRSIDERPALMIRKGNWKLMVHKMMTSPKIDMMFNLQTDPFEMNNLVGRNAATASSETLETAEHLRCLLLEWMERMDGSEGYYSHPISNYGEGSGDIEELRLRQSWPPLDFWTSHAQGLEMGRVVWDGKEFVRNEYVYLGSRTGGSLTMDLIVLTGIHASLFRLDEIPSVIEEKRCSRIQVRFASATLPTEPIDASLRIVQGQRSRAIPISFISGALGR